MLGIPFYPDSSKLAIKKIMKRKLGPLTATLFLTALLHGQESVCDLFKDLKAADGRRLIIQGELIISKDLAALGAADCDDQYESPIEGPGIRVFQLWPTVLRLKPSEAVPAKQIQQFHDAATKADRLRGEGKTVNASATLAGLVRVREVDGFPAELTFNSIENLQVEALPDPSELPVIPICELFQNLAAWKGKRIAVRGESSSTFEGSWITGRCKGSFYTNGYRWPVALDYAVPAYYSSRTAPISEAKLPSAPPKGDELFRGRHNVVMTGTYVGRLRMRSEYMAFCRESGEYMANGYGHLGYAVGELIVEAVRDVELTHRVAVDGSDDDEQRCQPPNLAALCAIAPSLSDAASIGCMERVREFLLKEGIDSKDGSESSALSSAIRTGNEALVKLLIDNGAPVNPVKTSPWSPLAGAADSGKIAIVKLLLKAGANVDGQDNQGATYLASYGFFDTRVTKTLLEAGANPNATNSRGETALMKASGYGYEDAIKLLIQHRAEVNLKDISGRTALMHAAAGKYVDAIPLLLGNGADLYARDRLGDTALDIARKSKNQVAVELLSAAMKNAR
jgi:ankyrin repeat protein